MNTLILALVRGMRRREAIPTRSVVGAGVVWVPSVLERVFPEVSVLVGSV